MAECFAGGHLRFANGAWRDDNGDPVEIRQVVPGEWISWEKADNFIPSPNRHECSVCHDAAQVLVNGFELLSPYCPNCGARMDGGSHDP